MKRKKKNGAQAVGNENIHQWRKNFALGKRREARKQQKETAEIERREIFDRKTSSASDKKAPFTLRTRGYYRFSAEYPSTVDENGFRENSSGRKAVRRRRVITAIVCLVVFVASFVAVRTCILLSERQPDTGAPVTDTQSVLPYRAYHFSYEEFQTGDTNAMAATLEEHDCNAAVFDFKDDFGYVLFNTGSFMGMSADKRLPGAYDTVNTLKAKGYNVAAYISCFKDTAASTADLTYSVRQNTYEGAAWLDNSGRGWLDPYSPAAADYLLGLIRLAADKGFDRILLGNVCFPSDAGNAQQCFAWEEESQTPRNRRLLTFISSAAKNSGSAKLTVLCDSEAFRLTADKDTPRYCGNLLGASAASFCLDARLSYQQKNVTIGTETFSDASLMPFVFVLAASENAVGAVRNSDESAREILICVEKGQTLADQLDAAAYAGADGFIIW